MTRTADGSTLTVAVCTRDRPAALQRAIDALIRVLPREATVLVVDNSAAGGAAYTLPGSVRVVHEPAPGLSVARNRALREARTELVAFVDDDTVVAPGWATALVETLRDAPEAAALCGRVTPLELESPGARAIEAYGVMDRGSTRRWSYSTRHPSAPLLRTHGNTSQLGVGANLAVRREVALALGGFDEALGAGTPTGGGEDLEFLFRAIKAGHAVGYEPAAGLAHAHRESLDAVLAQVESWGTGMRAYLERTATAYPEERAAARALLFWLGSAFYARRIVESFVRPTFPRSLLWRDLRGLRQGAARYHESAAGRPAPAAPRRSTPSHAGTAAPVTVDVDESLDAIRTSASQALVTVTRGGQVLGHVTVDAVNGLVGPARLRDAIASLPGAR